MSPAASPLLYLAVRSARNRAVARLRRLARPRYLLFALVGGLYFYFVAVRHWITGMSMLSRGEWGRVPADLVEGMVGGLLILAAAVPWILPAPASPLPFTEPEIHHLFPAPLPRRRLLQWKMVSSVPGALLGALIFSLGAGPALAHGGWLIFFCGACVMFAAGRLYVMGARLARHRLQRAGVPWIARAVPAAVVTLGALALALRASVQLAAGAPSGPWEDAGLPEGAGVLIGRARDVVAQWPMQLVTFPGRWLMRPAVAEGWGAFLMALPAALAVLAAQAAWVMRSRADLEDGALEASGEMQSARRMRAGRAGPGRVRLTPAPFVLRPGAAPVTALVWKALIRMRRLTGGLYALSIVTAAAMAPGAVLMVSGHPARAGLITGIACAALFLLMMLIGPGVFRTDFAGELRHIELLRGYPLPGRTMIAGMLLAPVAVLTLFQWGLLAAAIVLVGGQAMTLGVPLTAGLAAALVAGPVNLVSALVQNALVLLFPAWMAPGQSRPSGIEAMGFNIVSALARLLILWLCLLPAGLLFGGVWAAAAVAGHSAVGLALAGLAAAVAITVEAAFGVAMLGSWVDRSDVAAELASPS
ncbi:MAG: hypothetical protein ACREAA_11575 [Candidatus Polarisedimenticolia bacterium]